MPLRQKLSLVLLMALSLLAMAMSIMRTVYVYASYNGGSALNGYNQTSILTLALLEGDMVIMMGCIPPLRNHMKLHLSSFGSSISVLFSRTRSKQSALHKDYDSFGRYNDLEMDVNGPGFLQSNNTIQISTVAFHQANVNQDDLVRQNGVRRTDSFAVTGT